MKKILAVLLFLTLLVVSVAPALATPVEQLNDLARYFPADTPIFAASRLDDAFFSELDGIVAKVAAALPTGTIPPMTISEALDMALADAKPPLKFEADIRPWLGDTVAFGVLDIPMNDGTTTRFLRDRRLNDDAPVLFAVAIKDRATVTDFLTQMLDQNDQEYERTDEADYTMLTPPNNQGVVVIRDDVLLVSNQVDLATTIPDGSLSSSADFGSAFALLPEDDYNVTLFLNFGDLLQNALENDPDIAAQAGVFSSVFSAIGPQAWGATLLDGVSLTLDIAQQVNGTEAFGEFGLPTTPPPAIDPAFAARIPAGAPLAIHSTDLNRSVEALFAVLDSQLAAMAEAGMADPKDLEDAQQGIKQVESAFTTFTGLDLRKDVASWMTGDYALFLMLNPDLDVSSQFGLFQTFPVDFGLAIQATDPAAAAKTVEGLTEGLQRLAALAAENEDSQAEVAITTETLSGADVTVVTISSSNIPWPIEFLMGANDEVFALGTRNAVTAIFARDGGLPSSAAFTRAQDFMLAGAHTVAYLSTEGLLPLADLVETMANENDSSAKENAAILRDVLNLFPSASISQRQDASGSSVSRLVLTMAE
ncbi:MAG: DUF3352 domain-containing protein [Anaerolineae bacterium]|nr:DUF3352 domain-containing protein [Anaerolineae bacterium]